MSNMPNWYGGNQRDWGPPPSPPRPPMASQLDRMRNPQPLQARSGLPGRIIQDPNEITPGEVPMDGSVSVFLMEDLSRIIVSGWNAEGKLIPVVYTPEPQRKVPEPNPIPDEFRSAIFARLDGIENLLKNNMPKATKALAKKEESTNGSNG